MIEFAAFSSTVKVNRKVARLCLAEPLGYLSVTCSTTANKVAIVGHLQWLKKSSCLIFHYSLIYLSIKRQYLFICVFAFYRPHTYPGAALRDRPAHGDPSESSFRGLKREVREFFAFFPTRRQRTPMKPHTLSVRRRSPLKDWKIFAFFFRFSTRCQCTPMKPHMLTPFLFSYFFFVGFPTAAN